MGEGQFGGDGSVNWFVTTERPFGQGNRRTDGGIDGANGGHFVVRLKIPAGMSAQEFLESAVSKSVPQGDVVEFCFEIEEGVPTQIQVLWGQENTTTAS
jgi:hypothetical protein